MSSPQGKLTEKQKRAIVGLLIFPTCAAAAQYAGVHIRTLLRWRNSLDFSAKLKCAKAHLREKAGQLLAEKNRDVVDVLSAMMHDNRLTPANRIMAARALLRVTNEYIGLRTTYENSVSLEMAEDAIRQL